MNRRDFTRISGLGALVMHAIPKVTAGSMLATESDNIPSAEAVSRLHVPLGIGNHSLRAWRPNATELVDFAIEYRLDSVQFNTLAPFERLDEQHLKKLKKHALAHDISIYVGVGGICEKSDKFNNSFGDADTLVKEGIRVATALGSPVVGVRIGVLDDRYSGGGIRPKMEEVIKRMRSFRSRITDAGVKFAFENHAGDMRTEELLELIEATGTDICGAFFDPGNATYAMEDPKTAMEAVGKHILCCSARDVVIWQTDDGAMFQWTAVGEGIMDYKSYAQFMAEHCPGVPIHLEIISNSPRSIPFLQDAYWEGWPDLEAAGIIDFLKMTRKGQPLEVDQAPPGMDRKTFEMKNQEDELLRSVYYLRNECGVGLK
ncbi:MAG: TIM barrel protein [Bacteroidales bacterium]|nr:TIM barrel protein [Bacteroidales bacterium]MDT8432033.1 TIM barrel protein [Bacteroidales bacterium]